MLSVANLCSKMGFDRFKQQNQFKVAGFYFMSVDIICKLAKEAGFEVKEVRSESGSKNLYYERDICLLIQKSE